VCRLFPGLRRVPWIRLFFPGGVGNEQGTTQKDLRRRPKKHPNARQIDKKYAESQRPDKGVKGDIHQRAHGLNVSADRLVVDQITWEFI